MKSQAENKPVSTPLIIILVIVVIAAGVYYYFQMTTPANPQVETTKTEIAPRNTGIVNNISGQVNKEKTTDSIPIMDKSNRDPFNPSKLFVKSMEPEVTTVKPVTPVIPIKPITTSIPIVETKPVPTPPPPIDERIVWKGTVTSKNDEIVLLRYKNKPYSLRLGDKLPDTQYILAQINTDSIVLLSPKNKLELNRKKEAKN